MKILRTLLIILAVLVLIFVILGFLGPKTFDVSRSVVIDAPREVVFPYVRDFSKTQQWSPWAELDSNMVSKIEGTDGTVGAKHMWEGNEKVGKGEQTITGIKENENVTTDLKFLEPWESQATTYMNLEDAEAGKTKVTWGFSGENGFIARVMFLFMDMDAAIGADFEKGLNKLKTLVESDIANNTYKGFKVEMGQFPGQKYAGVRKKIKFTEIEKFYTDNLGTIFGAADDKAMGTPVGLYYEWNEETGETDMAAAIPVTQPVNGFETFDIPAGKMLFINYYGNYDSIGNAHMAMDEFVKEKGYNMKSPVIEDYVTDPGKEPDTTKWLTKIIYLVE